MNQRHLTEDRLIEMCLAGSIEAVEHDHLVACTDCEVRRAELSTMLAEVDAAATAEADAAFPEERLARQQARILHRLEQDGRPGRIIAFPSASHGSETMSLRTKPTTRWVAAAAAAGLLVGLVAGHMAHDFPVSARPVIAQSAARQQPTGTVLRGAAGIITDEEFLGEVEAAIDSTGPAALRPIDALTPRAWEVR
jgi:hypothetical protein